VKERVRRGLSLLFITAMVMLQIAVGGAQPAAAAPGDLIVDVVIPELWPTSVAPSVAFDGKNLYYADYGTSRMHRIDVPPAGGTRAATGHIDIQVIGAPSGIMTIAYDKGRDKFWAVGGDGLSVYLLTKTGAATKIFTIDPVADRPGFVATTFVAETKIAYDGTDDTIWYSPDATARIYHYRTTADALGTASLVDGTPYIDVNVPPNDMSPQCSYSQSSGVAVGGANLFIDIIGCPYYFEYTKTGKKVAAHKYNFVGTQSVQDLECDNVSYPVPVIWFRDGYNPHIRAFEQPVGTPCAYGGGAAPAPRGVVPPGILPPLPALPLPPGLR
jgi:hypothetical protein